MGSITRRFEIPLEGGVDFVNLLLLLHARQHGRFHTRGRHDTQHLVANRLVHRNASEG